ncbi:ComEC/Rec2 family competence protein [Pedobacter montanisoli]|uniref:ComEC family competence protein n=1 Tax=Pedobacter montanisoli TaxID=2923277 RepID=A0ABS9ZYX7_9SPHI|nr:ComEC/Rec2 family competence protein [Pedobacter montanisoli]MCJ0743497.1 ComEC family competence protein [Pedobacter montanisoli]
MVFKAEIVFIKVFIPFALGIITAYYAQNNTALIVSCYALLSSFLALLILNILYVKLSLWKHKILTGSLLSICLFFTGSTLCMLKTDFLKDNYFAKHRFKALRICISSEPQLKNDILRFEAEVTSGIKEQTSYPVTGKLLVALKTDSIRSVQLNYGDELLIEPKYAPVEPAYNPAEFDFKAWLATQNIYQQVFINHNQIVKLPSNAANPLLKYAINLRQKQVEFYRKVIKNDEAFAVASTLILGYRADLSQETLNAYSKTGTIHALSVSGMHVGIIYIMINLLLSRFSKNTRWLVVIKFLLTITLIWYYALITGLSASVLRSAIMLSAVIFARQLKRHTNSYNVFAFTAFILLVYDPFLIWDVGFQLSFLAVLGLVALQPPLYKLLFFKNYFLDKIWATIAVSMAAQITTLPLSIYYFHQFPVYFIVSNLFIVIPVILIMYIGLTMLIFKISWIAPLFEYIINFTNEGLKWIADLPFSGLTAIFIERWQIWVLSLFIVFISIGLIQKRSRPVICALCLLLCFQIGTAHHKILAEKQRKMIFFTLRKNYAAAFISSKEAILVTDLNPLEKNYLFFIKPALERYGVNQVKFIDWKTDTTTKHLIKTNHQITFYDKSFLLIDPDLNAKKIANEVHFNYIWLHQNPKIDIGMLHEQLKTATLLIDATNKDFKIAEFENEAKKTNFKTHLLKRNNALLVSLN